MDRNTWNSIIGFTLIFLIIFFWAKLNSPSKEDLQREQAAKDSIAAEEAQKDKDTPKEVADRAVSLTNINTDTIVTEQQGVKIGPFISNPDKVEEDIVLENSKVKIIFSSLGGNIKSVHLKDYQKVTHVEGSKDDIYQPLFLMADERNRFEYLIPWNGETVRTGQIPFQGELRGNKVVFTAQGEDGIWFKQEYTLADDDYEVRYVLTHQGLDLRSKPLQLDWQNHLDKLERNVSYEKIFSTVYYKPAAASTDYCNCSKDDQTSLAEPLKWFSHSNQFFNSTLIASKPFASAELATIMSPETDASLKRISSIVTFPAIAAGEAYPMTFYIGPNNYKRLRMYGEGVEDIIPFGWSLFGSINRHIIRPIFTFLSSFIGSMGIVIILLTLLVKMVLYPLTYKMLLSQAKMGALKPKLAHLKEKFKDDTQQIQIETMKIYREFGVNPLGGCLPMVLQMPIWIALYRFFPASIEFRQESFLWADDLSSYDAFIQLPFSLPAYGDHISLFTLLWVVTTIIYTYYSTREMDMSMNPAMKYVQYLMPVIFLFFFNNYASGLTAYMFISNVLNISQTLVTKNYIINHDKIREQLEANKLKPKKKSSFQERLENALKEQQKKQLERSAPPTKKPKK